MSQTIDRGTLDRLIARGRARGELSAADLRAALPVERMDVDALVLVMLELEAAGVSVEPDTFGPSGERPSPGSPVLPPRDPGPVPPARQIDSTGTAAADRVARAAATPEPAADERADVTRAVALAGAATLLVLGALLLML